MFTAVIRVERDYIHALINVWVVICQLGFSKYDIILSKLCYVKEHLLLMSINFYVKFYYMSDITS